jgi:hypothetical protein
MISGKGLKILSNLEPVDIFIFKAGYEYFDAPWEALKADLLLRNIIKWEGERAIIPLKKLTIEERRRKGASPRPFIPQGQIPLITEEINKDRRALGLNPL